MSQVKVKCNWSQIPNTWLKDKNLSLKAKGLISVMQSLPDNWDFSVRGLASILKEGVDAINAALQELESAGYLTREQIRENGKIIDTLYTLYEFPYTENSNMVKPAQYNTNIHNTYKRKTAGSAEASPAPFSVDVSKPQEGIEQASLDDTRKKEFALCRELLNLMGLSNVKPGNRLRAAVRARLGDGYSELDLRAIARWSVLQENDFYKAPHTLFSETGAAGATALMQQAKKGTTYSTR